MSPNTTSTSRIKEEVRLHFTDLAHHYRSKNYEQSISRGVYPDIYMRHQHILQMIGNQHTGKVLEIGVGGGQMQVDLHSKGHEVYGIDLSEEMVKGARHLMNNAVPQKHARLAVADIESLCFPNNHFDLLVAAGVLEYLPEPGRALSEISRVLKVGGIAVFSVRNLFCLGKPVLAVRDLLSQYPAIGPIVKTGMDFLRFILNRKADQTQVFARYDVPWKFRKKMKEYNLHNFKQAFYHFNVFPRGLERNYPKTFIKWEVKLERLSQTPLGYFGRGCIFMARKK